ncbi:MAG: hypothetical protein ACRDSR_08925 [Pseudonocardiaceae bacterium]
MSWTSSSHDVQACIGLDVGGDVEIRFLVHPGYPDSATLVIGESTAEITFDLPMVETLRDKADDAVRQLREAVAERKAGTGPRADLPQNPLMTVQPDTPT